MTDTYTGWDGKPYPWPPPNGWYEASDGRWWAPGTGPNPPAAPQQPAESAEQSFTAATTTSELGASTAQLPVTGDVGIAQSGTSPPGYDTQSMGDDMPHPPGDDDYDESERSGGFGRIAAIAIGVLALAGIGAAAFVVLGGDGNETAAAEDTSSTTAEPGEEGQTTEPTTDTTTDGETGPESTVDGETTSTETVSSEQPEDGSSTTIDGTSTTEEADSTTTAAPILDQVPEFRRLLADAGLTSDNLSDDDIRTFGASVCILANTAEDLDDYEDLRADRIEQTETELTSEELSLVVDSAVLAFCPDQAQRIGLGG